MIRKLVLTVMLVAGLGCVGVGVVSYFRGIPDDAIWIGASPDQARLQFAAIGGTFHVVYATPVEKIDAAYRRSESGWGGFYVKTVPLGWLRPVLARGGGAPFWAPAFLLLAVSVPGLLAGPLRRRRWRRQGRCMACGYPLKGLPDPRCPECGRPATGGLAPGRLVAGAAVGSE